MLIVKPATPEQILACHLTEIEKRSRTELPDGSVVTEGISWQWWHENVYWKISWKVQESPDHKKTITQNSEPKLLQEMNDKIYTFSCVNLQWRLDNADAGDYAGEPPVKKLPADWQPYSTWLIAQGPRDPIWPLPLLWSGDQSTLSPKS